VHAGENVTGERGPSPAATSPNATATRTRASRPHGIPGRPPTVPQGPVLATASRRRSAGPTDPHRKDTQATPEKKDIVRWALAQGDRAALLGVAGSIATGEVGHDDLHTRPDGPHGARRCLLDDLLERLFRLPASADDEGTRSVMHSDLLSVLEQCAASPDAAVRELAAERIRFLPAHLRSSSEHPEIQRAARVEQAFASRVTRTLSSEDHVDATLDRHEQRQAGLPRLTVAGEPSEPTRLEISRQLARDRAADPARPPSDRLHNHQLSVQMNPATSLQDRRNALAYLHATDLPTDAEGIKAVTGIFEQFLAHPTGWSAAEHQSVVDLGVRLAKADFPGSAFLLRDSLIAAWKHWPSSSEAPLARVLAQIEATAARGVDKSDRWRARPPIADHKDWRLFDLFQHAAPLARKAVADHFSKDYLERIARGKAEPFEMDVYSLGRRRLASEQLTQSFARIAMLMEHVLADPALAEPRLWRLLFRTLDGFYKKRLEANRSDRGDDDLRSVDSRSASPEGEPSTEADPSSVATTPPSYLELRDREHAEQLVAFDFLAAKMLANLVSPAVAGAVMSQVPAGRTRDLMTKMVNLHRDDTERDPLRTYFKTSLTLAT